MRFAVNLEDGCILYFRPSVGTKCIGLLGVVLWLILGFTIGLLSTGFEGGFTYLNIACVVTMLFSSLVCSLAFVQLIIEEVLGDE